MPLTQRVPKRGFKNPFRKDVEIVNVGELARLGDGATVDSESLVQNRLVRGSGAAIKLLGEGDSPKNLTVKLNRISSSARVKIEAKGIGEIGLCGVAAAVANAIYNATGARIREYPVTMDKLLPHLPEDVGAAA